MEREFFLRQNFLMPDGGIFSVAWLRSVENGYHSPKKKGEAL